MSYRFMQISDINFDSITEYNTRINKVLTEKKYEAFNSSIKIAIEKEIDAYIICGNLYDDQNLSFNSAKVISQGFKRLQKAGIVILYAHGFSDKSQLFAPIKDMVIDFDYGLSKWDFSASVESESLTVWGSGYSDDLIAMTSTIPRKATSQPVIGIMYIDESKYSDDEVDQIYENLKRTSFSYWALGGGETFKIIGEKEDIIHTCKPVKFDEKNKGAVIVKITNKGKIKTKKISLTDVVVHKVRLDNVEDYDVDRILDEINMVLKEKDISADDFIDIKIIDESRYAGKIIRNYQMIIDEINSSYNALVNLDLSQLKSNIDKSSYISSKTPLGEALKVCESIKCEDSIKQELLELANNKEGLCSNVGKTGDDELFAGIDDIILEAILKEADYED